MKTREESARLIEAMLNHEEPCKFRKGGKIHTRHHFGVQELRQIMDFIYEGEPRTEAERIVNPSPDKFYK